MQDPAETASDWPLRHVSLPPRAPLLTVASVLAMHLGMIWYFQFPVRQTPEKWFPPTPWLHRATDGLINGTFVAGTTIQLIVILGFLICICRFPARAIGLEPARLPKALGLTALIWAINQVVLLIVLALAGQQITLNPEWTRPGWPRAAGQWLGQLFGNTPLEEAVFRGFLLPQCLLGMLSSMPKARPALQIAIALVLSQALFALFHVFLNWHQPEGQWLLLAQFVMGLLFASVYLRTGNLFLAMGLHTLANNVSPLLKDDLLPGPGLGLVTISVGMLIAVIFGPSLVHCVQRLVNRPDKALKLTGAASSDSAMHECS